MTLNEKSRRIFRTAVNLGFIVPGPCFVCGAINTHGHHTDYSQPLKVIWLCPKHHRLAHRNLKTRANTPKKYCTKCKRERLKKHFYEDHTGKRPDGLTAVCRDCRRDKRRAILAAAHAADPIAAAVDAGVL